MPATMSACALMSASQLQGSVSGGASCRRSPTRSSAGRSRARAAADGQQEGRHCGLPSAFHRFQEIQAYSYSRYSRSAACVCASSSAGLGMQMTDAGKNYIQFDNRLHRAEANAYEMTADLWLLLTPLKPSLRDTAYYGTGLGVLREHEAGAATAATRPVECGSAERLEMSLGRLLPPAMGVFLRRDASSRRRWCVLSSLVWRGRCQL